MVDPHDPGTLDVEAFCDLPCWPISAEQRRADRTLFERVTRDQRTLDAIITNAFRAETARRLAEV